MSDNAPAPVKKGLPPTGKLVQALSELRALGSDNPKMPEGIFIQFLRALYSPKDDSFDTGLWYRTFGTLQHPVDIIDAGGQTIRVCPPIMGTMRSLVGVKKSDSASLIVETATLEEQRHAQAGQRALAQGLANYKSGETMDHRAAWRELLIHYGIIDGKLGATASQQATSDALLTGDVEEL